MNSFRLTKPVALIVYNRPDTTARVFNTIREARPPFFFVIADGPKSDLPSDADLCKEVRHIVEQVDWPCEFIKNYSDVNLGCGLRPATGISWVFKQVEDAIILEDDCLPHPSFFRYCEELLDKYRYDERIVHIAGSNSLINSCKGNYSYYYSLFPHCWGWASWRRAWNNFDYDMLLFREIEANGWLNCIFPEKDVARFWRSGFMELYHSKQKHIWDYQWTFACWANSGLSILPNQNLVSNIGFGSEATHTKSLQSKLASMPVSAMEFPLVHPPFVIRDTEADARAQTKIWGSLVLSNCRSIFKKLLKG